MAPVRNLAECIKQIPSADEIRRRLAENAEESKLLRKLLRLAEQKERVQEAGQ